MHNLVKHRLKETHEWNNNNNNNNFGEDSLEIATDELFDQSDLAERILDAEKKFSTSSLNTSHFASEYFEHPALYRVLLMGSVTEEKKKELFKKLSQGFVHVIQQQQQHQQQQLHMRSKNLSLLGQPIIPFKEIKHNILLLSDEDDPNLVSDICEDIGVSMIEADFTWNSNAVNYSNDPNNLLLQYAWHQCPNPRDLPSAWLESQIFTHSKSKFTGYMHPETTPNGIDLCVYFYDNDEDEPRTKEDLQLLCLLRKLGIYVLPLTTTRDESIKSHFADLLTEYKVRCLDLGNLEVGQEPSFFHKTTTTTATTEGDRLSRLQGMECTQSNVPRVATYQILAVDQFCGIENNAIFQLLKRTRERQVIRDEIKTELRRRKQGTAAVPNIVTDNDDDDDLGHSLDSLETTTTIKVSNNHKFKWISSLISLLVLLLLTTTTTNRSSKAPVEQPWTTTFTIDPQMTFTLLTKDGDGLIRWPKVIPNVWLNKAHPIPIQKIQDAPGKYQLLFDPFTALPHHDNHPFISFSFHANHSLITYEPSSTTTFVLQNRAYQHIAATRTTSATTLTQVPRQQHQPPIAPSIQHNVFQRTWRTFVFITHNYSNLYKIMIKK